VFDAHAHLQSVPASGSGWIVPGVDLASEVLACRLAGDPRVRAAIGLHPWYLPETVAELAPQLAALDVAIEARRPCAIGETGLDQSWRGKPKAVQRAAFAAQVDVARRLELPLIIHCVRAHGGCLDVLRGFPHGGMVHDFAGPREMIGPWVAAGFFLSISPRNLGHRAVIAAIPGERLLVETDDAGPERLADVVAAVAEHRGVTPEDVAAITETNARRLFAC
jgi:TatD DNase family protein